MVRGDAVLFTSDIERWATAWFGDQARAPQPDQFGEVLLAGVCTDKAVLVRYQDRDGNEQINYVPLAYCVQISQRESGR